MTKIPTTTLTATLLALGLNTVLGTHPATAQLLHPQSATRDLYAYSYVYCIPPVQLHHASTSLTTAFDDTLKTQSECGPPWNELSESVARQHSHLLDDAIDLQHYVFTTFGLSNPFNATHSTATSDATIEFRVEEGQRLAYTAKPKLEVLQTGSGLAQLSITLTGPNGILDSLTTQAGPSTHLSQHTRQATWTRILDPGDYTLETHARSQDAATAWGKLSIRLTLQDITATTGLTWGSVKALYRS